MEVRHIRQRVCLFACEGGGESMSVKWHTTFNKLPKVTAAVESMNGKKVKVGALQGGHAWL